MLVQVREDRNNKMGKKENRNKNMVHTRPYGIRENGKRLGKKSKRPNVL